MKAATPATALATPASNDRRMELNMVVLLDVGVFFILVSGRNLDQFHAWVSDRELTITSVKSQASGKRRYAMRIRRETCPLLPQ